MGKNSGNKAAFAIGAIIYPAIELLWRAKTHPAMSVLGGVCMTGIYRIEDRLRKKPALLRLALSVAAITAAELSAGCILNKWMKLKIWDYSDRRGNLLGQICPLYSLFWALLYLPAAAICRLLRRLTD